MDSLRDPVASASHFLMAFLAVVATLLLVRITRGERSRRLCALVFGTCTVILYTSSGLYHALQLPTEELRFYQKLDMSAIYLMIAGSTTPLAVLLLRGRFRLALLVGEWSFAAVGIGTLWLLPQPGHQVMVMLYLAMGWLGTAGLWHYWKATGWRGMRWAMVGAAFYTGGAVIELLNWPVLWPGVIRSHEMLHFCDIGGTACHLVFIARYVLPYRFAEAAPARVIGQPAEFAVPAEA